MKNEKQRDEEEEGRKSGNQGIGVSAPMISCCPFSAPDSCKEQGKHTKDNFTFTLYNALQHTHTHTHTHTALCNVCLNACMHI